MTDGFDAFLAAGALSAASQPGGPPLAAALLWLNCGLAQAIEPVKISREDTALDLTATTEIYTGRGEAFQVSTAPGTDGIVRRIEVRSSADNHQATGPSSRWPMFRKSSWSG